MPSLDSRQLQRQRPMRGWAARGRGWVAASGERSDSNPDSTASMSAAMASSNSARCSGSIFSECAANCTQRSRAISAASAAILASLQTGRDHARQFFVACRDRRRLFDDDAAQHLHIDNGVELRDIIVVQRCDLHTARKHFLLA